MMGEEAGILFFGDVQVPEEDRSVVQGRSNRRLRAVHLRRKFLTVP
jgi:hypothetical protein